MTKKKSCISKLSAEHPTSASTESHTKLQTAQAQSRAVFLKLDLTGHWK